MKRFILFASLISLMVFSTVGMPANRSFFLSEGNSYKDTTWTLPSPAQKFTIIYGIAANSATLAMTFTGSVTDYRSGTTTSVVDSIKVEGVIASLTRPVIFEYDHGYPVTTIQFRRSQAADVTVTVIPHN